jgi:gamma-glutamylcyclotransferase (GGCT)/AIG2-like uncharacterized protein YtfP
VTARASILDSIFAYGTLQLDAVMEAVTGRRFQGVPAVLDGYRRRLVADRTYPAVVPAQGEQTEGTLLRGLDEETLARLDVFEGPLYRRRRLPVRAGGGERVEAWVYVLAPEHRDRLSDARFDLADFTREHARAFVESCRRFREEGVG